MTDFFAWYNSIKPWIQPASLQPARPSVGPLQFIKFPKHADIGLRLVSSLVPARSGFVLARLLRISIVSKPSSRVRLVRVRSVFSMFGHLVSSIFFVWQLPCVFAVTRVSHRQN
jgi:hypothetical protein